MKKSKMLQPRRAVAIDQQQGHEAKRILKKRELNKPLTVDEGMIIILITLPSTDAKTNEYFNDALAHLTANTARLGVDPAKLLVFSNLIGGPPTPVGPPPNTNGTPHTWNYVYPLEKNEDTFTHSLQKEKDTLMGQINTALDDVFSDIPDSKILPTDTLHLHIHKKADRKPRTAAPEEIDTLVSIMLTALGGRRIQVTMRDKSDSKIASKLNQGVEIELAYSTVPQGATPPATPPATPGACPNKPIVTVADPVLQFADAEEGYKLYLWARWVYLSHPEKSGAFGSPVNITIT